jgi:hypothetical protein
MSFHSPAKSLLRAASAAVLCCLLAPARAEMELGILTFDAFGTLGMVHSSEHTADFNRSALSPKGAGFSDDLSLEVDSLLAGQVRAQLGPQWSATVQLVTELRYDQTWRPLVEWAYLQWEPTPDLAVRLGRTSSATFAITDTRRIGYAQHWVRPPSEIYDLIPVTTNDGFDIIWRRNWSGATHTLQVAAGQSEAFASPRGLPPAKSTSEQQLTLRYSFETGPFSVYANVGRNRLTVEGFEELFAAFSMFGPQGEAIAARQGAIRKRGLFRGIGASWDAGRWFAMGEVARLENPSLFGTKTGGYVSAGLRLGPFTPYLTWAQVEVDSARQDPGLDLSLVPPELVPVAAGLNATLNAILIANGEYSTISGGVRWDVAPSVAVKLQLEHIDVAHGSWGPFTNVTSQYVPGGTARVISATLSFVL